MDRIAIIGCGGSGKATIARQLGAALDIPVTHLDVVYYDSEWNTFAACATAAAKMSRPACTTASPRTS